MEYTVFASKIKYSCHEPKVRTRNGPKSRHNTPGNFLQESLLNREGYREVRIWVGMATGTITMGTGERGGGDCSDKRRNEREVQVRPGAAKQARRGDRCLQNRGMRSQLQVRPITGSHTLCTQGRQHYMRKTGKTISKKSCLVTTEECITNWRGVAGCPVLRNPPADYL